MAGSKTLDPRQRLATAYYTDPKSETFSNLKASCLRAGYGKMYSDKITGWMPGWVDNAVKRVGMLTKAEKNLDEALEMDTKDRIFIGEELVERDSIDKLKVKVDVSKFVAERIGRRFYGREEKDQPPVQININVGAAIDKIYGEVIES